MEAESSLSSSQEPAAGPYPKPNKSVHILRNVGNHLRDYKVS
jgi:hypothetical protein